MLNNFGLDLDLDRVEKHKGEVDTLEEFLNQGEK